MRLLHLIPNMLIGGAQRQLCYLAAEQHRSSREVHVGVFGRGPTLRRLEQAGATIHLFRAAGNHDPRLFREVWSLIRGIRPDIVQTWLNQMDVLGGVAARVSRTAWILSERASVLAYPHGVKVRLRELVARGADAIVSNSEEGNRYWVSRVETRVLLRVIRNGLPIGEIDAAPPASALALRLPDGHRMVLYAGRMSPQKNLKALIPALGEVCRRLLVTAYLCGDGTHEAETRALIARLGLERDVRLVGYVADVWSWMKRADVFVSVSHFEGHPNTVLEAAASGCPLVLSDIREHREMLRDTEAAFVDRTSPMAIADALESVLRNPVEAKRRAEAARAAVAPLSVEAMARGYDEVYREVLERRGTRGTR